MLTCLHTGQVSWVKVKQTSTLSSSPRLLSRSFLYFSDSSRLVLRRMGLHRVSLKMLNSASVTDSEGHWPNAAFLTSCEWECVSRLKGGSSYGSHEAGRCNLPCSKTLEQGRQQSKDTCTRDSETFSQAIPILHHEFNTTTIFPGSMLILTLSLSILKNLIGMFHNLH